MERKRKIIVYSIKSVKALNMRTEYVIIYMHVKLTVK